MPEIEFGTYLICIQATACMSRITVSAELFTNLLHVVDLVGLGT